MLAAMRIGNQDFVKKLLQNEPFRFLPKPFCSLVMKTKRTLPPTKVGARRPRRNFERSQKEDRDAIDAAFKRKIGDDGFRPHGVFGRKGHRS
jgi:hypothetical protein